MLSHSCQPFRSPSGDSCNVVKLGHDLFDACEFCGSFRHFLQHHPRRLHGTVSLKCSFQSCLDPFNGAILVEPFVHVEDVCQHALWLFLNGLGMLGPLQEILCFCGVHEEAPTLPSHILYLQEVQRSSQCTLRDLRRFILLPFILVGRFEFLFTGSHSSLG